MAYVKFYQPTNMDGLQSFYGDVLVANNSQIVVSDGVNSAYYFGSFAYSNNQVAAGVLTDVVITSFDSWTWAAFGLWVDAPTAQYYINTNQLQPLFAIALAGDDWLDGSFGNDLIRAYAGNDIVLGYDGSDILSGGLGNDWLQGGNGGDVLLGEGGNDFLFGEADNEWLVGGSGIDYLNGGQGADLFDLRTDVFYGQWDYLATFNPLAGDSILLPAAYANSVTWQQYGTDVIGYVGMSGYSMYVDGDFALTVAQVHAYTLFI